MRNRMDYRHNITRPTDMSTEEWVWLREWRNLWGCPCQAEVFLRRLRTFWHRQEGMQESVKPDRTYRTAEAVETRLCCTPRGLEDTTQSESDDPSPDDPEEGC